ncbi:MAG: PAS domain S-box protein [Gammaproteobacteria bacterium]|nr:PAS domain S-box protein [Gammaproteobacteria bacterium]
MSKVINPLSADFKAHLRSTPDIYLLLTPELIIVDASEVFLKTTMVTREQITGKNVFEIFPDNPNDEKADGEKKIRASFKNVIENKAPDTVGIIKYDIRTSQSKGGEFEERYWSVINSPILDEDNNLIYILNRSEDVTKFVNMKKTQQEQVDSIAKLKTELGRNEKEIYDRAQEIQLANKKLHTSLEEISKHQIVKSNLAAIVEATSDAVIGLLPDGTIKSWNKGAEKLYGYEESEVLGKNLRILYPLERLQEYTEVFKHIINDKSWQLETEQVHKNGHLLSVSLTISSIKDENNNVIAACSIARDIAEFKKITRMKNEFISIVSHELRTPLTSIQGSFPY